MRVLLLIFAWVILVKTSLAAEPHEWDETFPPHRIADNLFYVGSRGLASYLVTTTNGHLLINSSFERTVPLIQASIEQLGFKMGDVKILLSSHAHSDHVAGLAKMAALTRAKVYVMSGDEHVIRSGGQGQYLYADQWKPCQVDRILKDREEVNLGEATLQAQWTPGHTRGCTTWVMKVKDGPEFRNAVIIGSPNVNPGYQLVNNRAYPEIARDFEMTFKVLKSLPCDIFLGAHGNYYGMEAKYQKLKSNPKLNPFVDPRGYRDYVDEREKYFQEQLKAQAASGTRP